MRERIEGELDPPERQRRRRDAVTPPDPAPVLAKASRFAELARSGAYIAGDRRVSPAERTTWRVTFRRLAKDAQLALHAEDTAPSERAMELMIDLARDAEGSFRSEDPLEAARFAAGQGLQGDDIDKAAQLCPAAAELPGFDAEELGEPGPPLVRERLPVH